MTGVEAGSGRFPRDLGVAGPLDGALSIGVLTYVSRLDEALGALRARLRPGGWAIFNLTLRTADGYAYVGSELVARRVSAYAVDNAERQTEATGLRVDGMRPAGVTRAGLTVVILATRPAAAGVTWPHVRVSRPVRAAADVAQCSLGAKYVRTVSRASCCSDLGRP